MLLVQQIKRCYSTIVERKTPNAQPFHVKGRRRILANGLEVVSAVTSPRWGILEPPTRGRSGNLRPRSCGRVSRRLCGSDLQKPTLEHTKVNLSQSVGKRITHSRINTCHSGAGERSETDHSSALM